MKSKLVVEVDGGGGEQMRRGRGRDWPLPPFISALYTLGLMSACATCFARLVDMILSLILTRNFLHFFFLWERCGALSPSQLSSVTPRFH